MSVPEQGAGPDPGRRPEDWLMAHRGWPDRYPENSLSGMRAALKAGARLVEFDVQLTRDLVPVVLHDEHLGRVAGRDQRITALDADQAESIRVGERDRFGERFGGEPLPRLEQMLELVSAYEGATAFVEIKRASLRRLGHENVINAVLPRLRDAACATVVLSFDADILTLARQRRAGPVGWVIKPWGRAAERRAVRLAPDYLFVKPARIPAGPSPFWRGPWQWVVYDVNEAAQALALKRRGADLIETDRFADLASEIRDACNRDRGASHEP